MGMSPRHYWGDGLWTCFTLLSSPSIFPTPCTWPALAPGRAKKWWWCIVQGLEGWCHLHFLLLKTGGGVFWLLDVSGVKEENYISSSIETMAAAPLWTLLFPPHCQNCRRSGAVYVWGSTVLPRVSYASGWDTRRRERRERAETR